MTINGAIPTAGGSGRLITVATRENDTVENRPKLVVTYDSAVVKITGSAQLDKQGIRINLGISGSLNIATQDKASISLLSISGKTLLSVDSEGGEKTVNLKSYGISNGAYIARVLSKGKTVSQIVNLF